MAINLNRSLGIVLISKHLSINAIRCTVSLTKEILMGNFFKKLKLRSIDKKNAALLKRAVDAQRNGKLELYGQLIQESENLQKLKKEIEADIAKK